MCILPLFLPCCQSLCIHIFTYYAANSTSLPIYLVVVAVILIFKSMVTGLDCIQVYTFCWSILNVQILFLFYSASVIIPVGCDAIFVSPDAQTMLVGSWCHLLTQCSRTSEGCSGYMTLPLQIADCFSWQHKLFYLCPKYFVRWFDTCNWVGNTEGIGCAYCSGNMTKVISKVL